MSIEGGAFNCGKHNFTTVDVKEWDEHCFKENHTLTVQQICEDCGTVNEEKEYPYPKKFVEKSHASGSGIKLQCKECSK